MACSYVVKSCRYILVCLDKRIVQTNLNLLQKCQKVSNLFSMYLMRVNRLSKVTADSHHSLIEHQANYLPLVPGTKLFS